MSPETVVRWHRSGFALYWRLISRTRRMLGRRRISKEIRDLLFRMVTENPTWGAPRIHRELLILGFDVSQRIISRWMRRAPRNPYPARRRSRRQAEVKVGLFSLCLRNVPQRVFLLFGLVLSTEPPASCFPPPHQVQLLTALVSGALVATVVRGVTSFAKYAASLRPPSV